MPGFMSQPCLAAVAKGDLSGGVQADVSPINKMCQNFIMGISLVDVFVQISY